MSGAHAVLMFSGSIAAIEPSPDCMSRGELSRVRGIRTSCLDNTEEKQDPLNLRSEDGHQASTDDSTTCDTETDGKKPDTSFMERSTINCVDLDDPEDDDRNEVDTGSEAEKADDEEQTLVLNQLARKQRVLGNEFLVDDEDDEEYEADSNAGDNMG